VRVVLLTANPRGVASRFLTRGPRLPGVELAAVVLDEATRADRRARLRIRLRKLRRLGPGAIPVALALRRLYAASAGDEADLASFGLPVHRVPTLNGPEAQATLRELAPDLAVSLHNRILREPTFSIPRLGTINVHHGATPEYRGMPPVFWELRDGRETVGFTIHRIDAGIDTGPVLAAGEVPIERRPSLGATLAATLPRLYDASLEALDCVLAALATGSARERAQERTGLARTTPGLRDFLRVRTALRL
jgi:hypothetical protein